MKFSNEAAPIVFDPALQAPTSLASTRRNVRRGVKRRPKALTRALASCGREVARHRSGTGGAETAAADAPGYRSTARTCPAARHRYGRRRLDDLRSRLFLARPRLRARADCARERRLLACENRRQSLSREANLAALAVRGVAPAVIYECALKDREACAGALARSLHDINVTRALRRGMMRCTNASAAPTGRGLGRGKVPCRSRCQRPRRSGAVDEVPEKDAPLAKTSPARADSRRHRAGTGRRRRLRDRRAHPPSLDPLPPRQRPAPGGELRRDA